MLTTYCATTTSNDVFGKDQALGVHDLQALDMLQALLGDALARLAQHGLGQVDADHARGRRVVRQADAGADADVENAPADAIGGGDGRVPRALEHRAEDEIVDRRPARICLGHRLG